MRRYASVVYAVVVCLCVRLSVCLSVTSQCSPEAANAQARKQRRTIDSPGTLVFSDAKNVDEIRIQHLQPGLQMQVD